MSTISGKDQKVKFGTTTLTKANCIQDSGLDDAINSVVYQCNGYDKGVAGTRSAVFNLTLAIAATDHVKLLALAPGATGTFDAWPGGHTSGNVQITATSSMVVSANKSAPVNGVLSVDISIRLRDIEFKAATSTVT